MGNEAFTLGALLRATGALSAAAVCRVGADVARNLVGLHGHGLCAAPSLSSIIVDGTGARIVANPGGGGTPSDDLYALGAALAEAALGHPFPTVVGSVVPEAGSKRRLPGIRTLGTGLPERVVDAIEVLTAPEASRLRNASAAERVFLELEKLYGDGSAALQNARRQAASLGGDTIPDGKNPMLAPPISADGVEPRTLELDANSVLSLAQLRAAAARVTDPSARVPDDLSRHDPSLPKTLPPLDHVPMGAPLASPPARDTSSASLASTLDEPRQPRVAKPKGPT
ncbi:MAG TPA: hypothetical protein VGO62_14860, partial [Myxococcota bacterium]